MKSLCQQLAYCYSANTHSSNPAHLHLTSLTGRIGATLTHQSAGLENWIMSRSEESYDVALADQKQDLVRPLSNCRLKLYLQEQDACSKLRLVRRCT